MCVVIRSSLAFALFDPLDRTQKEFSSVPKKKIMKKNLERHLITIALDPFGDKKKTRRHSMMMYTHTHTSLKVLEGTCLYVKRIVGSLAAERNLFSVSLSTWVRSLFKS